VRLKIEKYITTEFNCIIQH